MVVICRVSNVKDIVLSPNQLQAAYTDVRHWEELIDFINKNGCPKEPYTLTSTFKCTCISNNPSFRLKHPGVPDGSDGSDGTSYPLTENYTLPVAQATGRNAYSPPLLCARYTHHQNDTCVTLFPGAAVML